MAAAKDTQPIVADDDVPDLVPDAANPAVDAVMGKQAKRYAKAMAKLGLKPEPGVLRVQIRKNKGVNFGIAKPEVYRFPGTNTFVIFGETQMEDLSSDMQRAAARAVSGAADAPATAATAAPVADDANEAPEDATGLGDKEIEIVMAQGNVSRNKAIRALKANKGDIVNAIMELTMSNA